MNVFQRQIVKGSASNMAGMVLGVVNNIWIFPLAFSLAELGIYRWVERTAVLVAAVALLGLHRLYVRFQSKFSQEAAAQFLSNVLFVTTALSAVVGAVLTFFAQEVADAIKLGYTHESLRTLGAVVAGSMLYTLGLSVASSEKRISVPFFLKNVGVRLALLLGAWAVSVHRVDFTFWMSVFAWSHLIVGVGVLLYAIKLKGLPLRWPKSLGMGMSKSFTAYASNGIIMGIMTMSLASIDSQIIASKLGVEALGIYSIAFFIGSFVDGIRRPVSQALSPQFANLWNDHNIAALGRMYGRTSRVLMVVALAAFLVIVPNLDFIFGLIPDPERFELAKPVVIYILVSRIVDYSFGSNGEILSNGPHYVWNIWALTVLIALLIWLNIWLLDLYGLVGSGYALVIAFAVFNLFKAWLLWHKEKMQPFGKIHLHLLLLAGLGFIIASQFSDASPTHFIFRNATIALTLLSGFFWFRKKI